LTDKDRTRVVRVVAIDGPAGAGKSTLALAVASHLGLERLDTGAMYRLVAWAALRAQIDPSDQEAVGRLARRLDIVVDGRSDGRGTVTVDGADATAGIRTPEVDAVVSAVAANPEVRTEMVRRQRAWVAERGGGVVEGRDIGTVVLPEADVKVYLTAASMARAQRRAAERGDSAVVPDVAAAIIRRDTLDSTRAVSPLPGVEAVPADAVVIDSTDKDAAEVLEEVLRCL
jgi:CMP/dCMP kinase